ncbi:hypothetical protein BC939DRAFT_449049 [Gamsiella multidivaricata]|uniref:uncharacterized protein n=1 Tax=Gamsiella multidivaricata TaxID=101098 RepID=UPI00221FF745|nr:uncharacterized protein BC939DRAFT_449049 [Gamsiella multidivaricata]KAI7825221.1 hypothetical protein BC939DRAFT_449049 [Gamsiella multidivaricata]
MMGRTGSAATRCVSLFLSFFFLLLLLVGLGARWPTTQLSSPCEIKKGLFAPTMTHTIHISICLRGGPIDCTAAV